MNNSISPEASAASWLQLVPGRGSAKVEQAAKRAGELERGAARASLGAPRAEPAQEPAAEAPREPLKQAKAKGQPHDSGKRGKLLPGNWGAKTAPGHNCSEQIISDEREEMVEDVLDECLEAYWNAGGGGNTGGWEDEAHLRTVLLTAANLWGIDRDKNPAQ